MVGHVPRTRGPFPPAWFGESRSTLAVSDAYIGVPWGYPSSNLYPGMPTFPAGVPIEADGLSSATLSLTAPYQPPVSYRQTVTRIARDTAQRVPRRYRVQTARGKPDPTTFITLAASNATSTATLDLTAPTQVPLDTAAGQSSATLALTAPTQVPLGVSTATSSATLTFYVPGVVFFTLTSAGSSSATLAVTIPPPPPPIHGGGTEFVLVRARAREYSLDSVVGSELLHG